MYIYILCISLLLPYIYIYPIEFSLQLSMSSEGGAAGTGPCKSGLPFYSVTSNVAGPEIWRYTLWLFNIAMENPHFYER